ncbi:MAG TPA: alpha/beta hydrolase [Candidatus Dormibacteraeota bacterium]
MIEELELEANGLTFRALADGPADGPVALLLHGFPEGAESWLPQLEILGAAGVRAVAPDQRGYGGTDVPEGIESYLMPNFFADIDGLIAALGVEQVDLAGHDWGAIIGWQYTSRRQEKLRSWAALSVGHPHALRKLVVEEQDADQLQRSSYIQLFNQQEVAERVLLEDDAQRLRAFYQGIFPRDIEDHFISDMQRPGRLTAALNYYRANLNAKQFATWEPAPNPITVPTLLIWGTDDIALGQRQAELTGEYLQGPYHFAPLTGASHWLQHDRPDAVSSLLLEHVKTARAVTQVPE